MTYSPTNRSFPGGNPIANALVVIVGVLAIAASIVLGFVAFVVLAALVTVLAAVIGIRLWWFNRKHRGLRTVQPGDSLEGEFIVVSRPDKNQD